MKRKILPKRESYGCRVSGGGFASVEGIRIDDYFALTARVEAPTGPPCVLTHIPSGRTVLFEHFGPLTLAQAKRLVGRLRALDVDWGMNERRLIRHVKSLPPEQREIVGRPLRGRS